MRVLIGISGWGYWGEELLGPLEVFDAAGYDVELVTPKGNRPVAIGVSMDPDFVDPPLGRTVTSEAVAGRVAALDRSPRLDSPISLSQWFPDRPYMSAPRYLRDIETYYEQLDRLYREDLPRYDALLLVGGADRSSTWSTTTGCMISS